MYNQLEAIHSTIIVITVDVGFLPGVLEESRIHVPWCGWGGVGALYNLSKDFKLFKKQFNKLWTTPVLNTVQGVEGVPTVKYVEGR